MKFNIFRSLCPKEKIYRKYEEKTYTENNNISSLNAMRKNDWERVKK